MNCKLTAKSKPARLAQSVEHETLNLRVVGSSPTLGDHYFALWGYEPKFNPKLLGTGREML